MSVSPIRTSRPTMIHSKLTALLTLSSLLALGRAGYAQTPTVILREHDPLGPSGHLVSFITRPDVNQVGGFAVRVRTDLVGPGTVIDHVWGNPVSAGAGGASLLVSELTGVAGYDQTEFEGFFGLDDVGSLAYGPLTNDLMTMTTALEAVWQDMSPVLVEGASPITEPTLVSRFNSAPNIIDTTGEPVWLSGLDTAGGTDAGRRIYRGTGHTVVLSSGPAPAPLVDNISTNGIRSGFRFSAAGTHWIAEIDTDSSGAYILTDGAVATTSSTTLIGETEAIPGISGGLGGAWGSFHQHMGTNESGDFMFTGNTTGNTATDEFLALNGDIILRESDIVSTAGGGPNYVLGSSIHGAAMNESGDIAAIWDAAGGRVLLVNGEVILIEGDEVDWTGDGVIDAGHVAVEIEPVSLAIGPRSGGRVLVYAALVVDDGNDALQGLLCMGVQVGPAFIDLCSGDGGNQMGCTNCPCTNNTAPGTVGGCLNSAGTAARLLATGDQSVSLPSMSTSDLRFGLSGAPPGAFCILNSGDAVAPGNMANPCFGMNSGSQAVAFDGLRCAITNTRRHGGRSADANGDVGVTGSPWGGEGGPPVGIAVAGGGFAAGQTRYFQVINRDEPLAVCMRGLNTSQAREVIFTP